MLQSDKLCSLGNQLWIHIYFINQSGLVHQAIEVLLGGLLGRAKLIYTTTTTLLCTFVLYLHHWWKIIVLWLVSCRATRAHLLYSNALLLKSEACLLLEKCSNSITRLQKVEVVGKEEYDMSNVVPPSHVRLCERLNTLQQEFLSVLFQCLFSPLHLPYTKMSFTSMHFLVLKHSLKDW